MAEQDKAVVADENKIDHYVKLSIIANGKHAQILEVQEENTNNRFAMKILLPEAMKEPEQIASLKYEGKVAQSLDHPNIIKWFATVHRKSTAYLILELFRSMSVKNFIINDHLGVQTRIRKLVDSTSLALQHMHEKGWLHLDVKPDNILMSRSSEVKLIDFSLSQKAKGLLGKMLSSTQAGGTLTYIAPESIRKEAPTPQTDIYSFGISIFECLTATFPFKGNTPKDLMMKHLATAPAPPSDFNKNVTPEMDRMVLRMIAKKPKDRQKSMQEVMSEFRNIQPFKEDPEKLAEQKAAEIKASSGQQNLGERLDSRTDHARIERAKIDPAFAKELAEKEAAKIAKEKAQKAAEISSPKSAKAQAAAKAAPVAPLSAVAPPLPVARPVPPAMPPAFPPQMMPGQMMPGQMMPGQMMPGQFAQMPGMPPMMSGQYPQMPGQFAPMPGYQGMPPGYPANYPPGAGMMPMQPGAMMPAPGMAPMQMPPNSMPVAPPIPAAQRPNPQPQPPATPRPQVPRPAAAPIPRAIQRPAPPPVPKDIKADELPTMDELPDVM